MSFGASPTGGQQLAVGDFNGEIRIHDFEKGGAVAYSIKGHKKIVNSLDAIGGLDIGNGAPEIVTGSRDGSVKLWDPRQSGAVLSLEPSADEDAIPDCWAVAFGNSFNDNERSIVAGYDNGDIKLFDLRMNQLVWDYNLPNGICGLQFDRKDTKMNKLIASTLEGKVTAFDMRTYNIDSGYASVEEKYSDTKTIWGVSHLPQNRDLFGVMGGDGKLGIYRYNYPGQRAIKDANGNMKGVAGTLELINDKVLSPQPIVSLDWHSDKLGLGCMACLDQTCKVIIVTKLHLY